MNRPARSSAELARDTTCTTVAHEPRVACRSRASRAVDPARFEPGYTWSAAWSPPLAAVGWDTARQRWRDAPGTPYDAGKIATYDHADALVGQVEKATGTVVGGWNSNDAEYLAWKAQDFTDGVYGYVYEGYLLFAYLVTDEDGQVARAVAIDGSFHVLWKTSQRSPGPNDSPPTLHTFVANGASDWYASSQSDEVRSIYAEWEPTRARHLQKRITSVAPSA